MAVLGSLAKSDQPSRNLSQALARDPLPRVPGRGIRSVRIEVRKSPRKTMVNPSGQVGAPSPMVNTAMRLIELAVNTVSTRFAP
jgi:hypothetical protein